MTPRYVHSNSTLLVLLLMTTINPSALQARQFAGGAGTQADPYQVATASQLDSVRYFATAHFLQTVDIDLNTSPYNIGHGWDPIPNFSGSYSGGGYAISNLYIRRAAADTVGLFSRVSGASLTNLILSNPSVNGNNVVGTLAGSFSTNVTAVSRIRVIGGSVWGNSYLGGLVGSNEGIINQCVATGMSINGTHSVVGGLAGSTSGSGSSISNSHATNQLSGILPGGLVGSLSGGTINYSYTASSGAYGLVANHTGGSIITSFYNADSSLVLTTNGTPLPSETMRQQASFFGWNFSSIWVIVDEGRTFPELRAFADLSLLFTNGTGTKVDPYQVKTSTDLNRVRLFPSAHFKQKADIGLEAYQSGKGWAPIQDFTGSYDGGGYSISGLVINRPATDMVGLFANVTEANLTNLTLSEPSVIGNTLVGTLAGVVNSEKSIVSKIRVTGGSIKGTSSLGGLIGNNEGAISLSAVSGITIEGSGSVIGGLTGRTRGSGSSISNSYAVNKLNGGTRVGALTSILTGGTITNSYSASSGATGLVHTNYSGTITNSYFNSDSSASNSNGDSLNTAQMSLHASFRGFDFSETWYFDPTKPDGFPLLREFTSKSTPTFSGGSGTPENPYLVATAGDIADVSLLPGAHYKQIADINLGAAPFNTGSGWRPIPDFKGSFDGGGYVISNLVIKRAASDTIGLFAKITGATLTKLNLSNPSVTGRNVVGALAGALNSAKSKVSEVQITGGSVNAMERLGGLAGASEGVISQSAATGMSISGGGWVLGGLVGITTGAGSSISNSYAINKMSSSMAGSSPGGLIGFSSSTTIKNSYTASSGSEGIVASNGGRITNSYFNGDSSSSSSNGDSLTTAQMSLHASFGGFDFAETWYFDPTDPDGLPLLRKLTLNTPSFSGGAGTPGNPYLVASAADLAHISLRPGSHFKQTKDIDLGIAPYNTGIGWRPIYNFTGSYNGEGYTISNLVINRPSANNTGLFGEVKGVKISNLNLNGATVTGRKDVGVLAGSVSNTSTITQVSLSNLKVVGSDNTGGLAGQLTSGSILTESYSSQGSVTGLIAAPTGGLAGFVNNAAITSSHSSKVKVTSGNNVGGLIGVATASRISDCYAINRVSGSFAGGLVGVSVDGSMTSCYSAGKATGGNASGIVGFSTRTTYANAYFNSDSTSSFNSIGTALKTEQMHQGSFFTGFDFTTKWVLPVEGNTFPELRYIIVRSTGFTSGSGTLLDPFQIATADQLHNTRLIPNAHYLQTADINLAVPPYNTGEGWLPIPGFSGSYDGKDHSISNLFINRGSTNNVGLFGSLNGGGVENIILNNPFVTGQDYVGALVGFTGTTKVSISNIRIIGGSVKGANFIGGMVGRGGGAITYSYATGMSVKGSVAVGGLVGIGTGTNNSIAQSYAINKVQGVNTVGGLVAISGDVSNSYSASKVTATIAGAEGLVSTSGGSIVNSYYNKDSTAVGLGNGTALTTTQMRRPASFDGFDFDTIWVILNEGLGFPELQTSADFSVLFAGGTGTEVDPYRIKTPGQLYNVRQFPSRHYRQVSDIDLNVSPYNAGTGWLPIPGFSGSYDGDGFSISNAIMNQSSLTEVGLFGKLDGGRLTDLIFRNFSISGGSYTGTLVGSASNNCAISRIRISGGIISSSGVGLGGLAGTSSSCSVSNVQVLDATIASRAATDIGGVVGSAINTTISRAVVHNFALGGAEGSDVGGIAGELHDGSSVSESAVTGGNIENGDYSGGLVGRMTTSSITNSYSNIVVSGMIASGGLVGILSGGSINTSYSASKALGNNKAGLVSANNRGTITNSFYNRDSTRAVNGNGSALSTDQMRQKVSFNDFDFATIWFIDEGSGFPGLQERKENELIISGKEGWRMLTSPLHSHSVGRLFKDLWLQGFKGADQETGSPNLYVWNETRQRWEVPADSGYTPGGGKGLLIYVYNDDNADGTPEGFPKRLEYSGSGISGEHSIDLTYIDTGSKDDDGWNLVGNPYPSTIHWDAVQGWTRANMDNVVYVWSESANSYLAWNGKIGGLKDGKIAPWQAFWVRATGANPRITFTDAVKSAGGTLFKQASQAGQEFPHLSLELVGNGLSSTSMVMFDEQAEVDKDPLDAYKLHSINQDDYLLLGTSVDGKQAMDIQALPVSGGEQQLEVVIEGSNLNGEFSLSWTPAYLSKGWAAELVDTKTGESFSLADTASYTFSLSRGKVVPKENETNKDVDPPTSPVTPVIKSKKGPSRFVIRFHLATSSEIDIKLPKKVELLQNYPNPFNPGTTINYKVPEQGDVRLEVFDMLGRKVATLVDNERKPAGQHQVHFDARELASGVYLYRLKAGGKVLTKQLTLIK